MPEPLTRAQELAKIAADRADRAREWLARHSVHFSHIRLTIFVSGEHRFRLKLNPYTEEKIMVEVTVGHNITCTLEYLDTNGNPMLVKPTPEAAPAWSNTTPATETLKVAADGNSCEADTLEAGSDVITVSLAVGGKAFTASVSVTVDAAPQVLGSVQIATTVS